MLDLSSALCALRLLARNKANEQNEAALEESLGGIHFGEPTFDFLTWQARDVSVSHSAKYWASYSTFRHGKANSSSLCDKLVGQIVLGIGAGCDLLSTLRKSVPTASAEHWVWTTDLSRRAWIAAVGRLWSFGFEVKWENVCEPPIYRRVRLPTYSFDLVRFSNESTPNPSVTRSNASSESLRLSVRDAYWSEHQVHGQALLPATGFLALVKKAAQASEGQRFTAVREIRFLRPLVLERAGRTVRVVIDRDQNSATFEVQSSETELEWQTHAEGTLGPEELPDTEQLSLAGLILDRDFVPEDFYSEIREELDIWYGPSFRGVKEVYRASDGSVVARIGVPRTRAPEGLPADPAFLDACLHPCLLVDPKQPRVTRIPQRAVDVRISAMKDVIKGWVKVRKGKSELFRASVLRRIKKTSWHDRLPQCGRVDQKHESYL